MFRSATLKLTLYYLAMVMVISLAFSVVLYRGASNELASRLQDQYRHWNVILRYFDTVPQTPQPFPPDPQEDLERGRHELVLQLFYFNVIVLVTAGAASYLLARRTLEPIESAHEQQKRFTADVSHELRTPLTALKMESEVALMDPEATAASLKQTLASNLEETAKLETLINNLLRLSQLENSQAQEGFTSVSVKALVDDTLSTMKPLADERQIHLTAKSTDIRVPGDQTTLTQLLTIIVDNAIKYSPNKSEISLVARRDHNQALITVTDQGVGIDKDALPHIFDRFYRANKARNKTVSNEGFGLGLSLAKMITDLHQGTIKITSTLDKGTTVTVALPIAQSPASSTANARPRGPSPQAQS